nr:MAG TPA: hypothetical protein [Caudoviricetes sp.]
MCFSYAKIFFKNLLTNVRANVIIYVRTNEKR